MYQSYHCGEFEDAPDGELPQTIGDMIIVKTANGYLHAPNIDDYFLALSEEFDDIFSTLPTNATIAFLTGARVVTEWELDEDGRPDREYPVLSYDVARAVQNAS
jgi:hypothetical protein